MPPNEDAVPIERLLEHSRWVRALAYSLVHDAGLVDDVVQQTWLAAMRAPPRDENRVRAWLRAVVKNLAREAYRSSRTRESVEAQAARPEATSSTAALYDRAERERILRNAVMRLPEMYSAVILLRFGEALPPRKIAERLGVPVETVRTRLRRAIELLREELTDPAQREGTDWAGFLLPLTTGLTGATTGSETAPATGVRPRTAAWTALGILCAIGGSAWLVAARTQDASPTERAALPAEGGAAGRTASQRRDERGGRAAEPAGAANTAVASSDSASDAAADALAAAEADAAAAAAAAAHIGIDFRGAAPDSPISLRVSPVTAEPRTQRLDARTVTSQGGALTVDTRDWRGVEVVSLDFLPDHPELVPYVFRVPYDASARTPLSGTRLRLFRAAIVTGTAGAPEGVAAAAEGAAEGSAESAADGPITVLAVRVEKMPPRAEVVDLVRCARDAPFRLRMWTGEEQWVVVLADGCIPRGVRITPAAGGPNDVGPLVLEAGLTISGRVTTASAAGAAGPPTGTGRVVASIPGVAEPIPIGEADVGIAAEGVVRHAAFGVLRPDGGYTISGLTPGEYSLHVVGSDVAANLPTSERKGVTPPAQAMDFVLPPVSVIVHAPAIADRTPMIVQPRVSGMSTAVRVLGGEVRLRALAGCTYDLRTIAPDGTRWSGEAVVPPEGADPVHVTLRPETAPGPPANVVEIEVAGGGDGGGGDGGGVDHVALGVFEPGVPPGWPAEETHEVDIVGGAGRATLRRGGKMRLVARPGATWTSVAGAYLDETLDAETIPGEPLRWRVVPRPGGRLRVLVHDAVGRPVNGALRLLRGTEVVRTELALRDATSVRTSATYLSLSGVSELLSALEPGEYVVEVTHRSGPVARTTVTIAAGRESLASLTLSRK